MITPAKALSRGFYVGPVSGSISCPGYGDADQAPQLGAADPDVVAPKSR
jgi:hypothetical protein